jgi:hypothetical protein
MATTTLRKCMEVLRTKKIVLLLRVPGDHIFYRLKGECPVTSQVDEEVVTTRERGGSRVLHVPLHWGTPQCYCFLCFRLRAGGLPCRVGLAVRVPSIGFSHLGHRTSSNDHNHLIHFLHDELRSPKSVRIVYLACSLVFVLFIVSVFMHVSRKSGHKEDVSLVSKLCLQ